jgi:hypothetical protein
MNWPGNYGIMYFEASHGVRLLGSEKLHYCPMRTNLYY